MDFQKLTIIVEGKIYNNENYNELLHIGNHLNRFELVDLYHFLVQWFSPQETVCLQTSGSTGTPKKIYTDKRRMMASARQTCRALSLHKGDKVLLCMNLRYIGAMMMVVRALVQGLNLIVRPASSYPLMDINERIVFAAMVPLQVYHCVQTIERRQRFSSIQKVLIGGGEINRQLAEKLSMVMNEIYSSYGMTETLSHIALRRVNGDNASLYYHPFSNVYLSQSKGGTLIINAPEICETSIETNDIVCFNDKGDFQILGRVDNIINTGGVKVYAEVVERELSPYFSCNFSVTSVKDMRLGEKIVLLLEDNSITDEELKQIFSHLTHPYYQPRIVLRIANIPMTANHKVDRRACKKIAEVHL